MVETGGDDVTAALAGPAERLSPSLNTVLTFSLCFAAALSEGYGLQAAGLAAPKLVPVFHLSPGQLGWVFSGNTSGLFLGAAIGGWIADRVGRRIVLIASMLAFGVFSLVTPLAPTPDILILMRFLTGLGLGGAMPNLIALCAETGGGDRATKVTMLTAGVPFGGALASLYVFSSGPELDWRQIFYVGGIAPIVVALVMMFFLSESRAFVDQSRKKIKEGDARRANPLFVLFGEDRALKTVLLWSAGFFTLVILYLLLNWLPVLLISKGLTRPQATLATMVFSFGGGGGAIVLGFLMAKISQRLIITFVYAGIAAGLLALATMSHSPQLLATAAFFLGFFVVGAQYLLYGLTPTYYPAVMRGAGVGWAVAVGRLGSVAGPALAAALLSSGRGASDVLGALMPMVAIGCLAVLALIWKPYRLID